MTDKNIQMTQYNGTDYDNLFPITFASLVKTAVINGYAGTDAQALLAAIGLALLTHKTSSDHDNRYFTETELKAITDGSSGADLIGATGINGLTGTTVQALLEGIKQLVDTVNSSLSTHKTSGDHDDRYFTETELKAITDGSAGADLIGATGISGLTGTTVQTLLESIKQLVDSINSSLSTHKASGDHDGRYFTETELRAITDGTAGADLIGATGITGLSGNTVQALLENLKSYIDSVEQGLDPKDSVRIATTANITLSGLQTIDGVTLAAGNRVLVKDQTTQSQNGIYVASSGAWTRAADADTGTKLSGGAYTFVEEGTVNADSGWTMTQNGTITIGTTAITWAQFSGAGQILAVGGLTKSGNTLSIASDGVTSAMLAPGAADDTAIGNRTIVDTTAANGYTSSLTGLLGALAYMIKAITGKSNYYTAPATTLEAANTHIAAAAPHSGHVLTSDVVTAATANKILKLNASGQLPANITGNAATATKLATARTITLTGDVSGTATFDGSGNISITVSGDQLVPPGAILPLARNTAPTGWLKCNGAAISRTAYSALFAAIGTTFGAGDGSTTFNIPDSRGYFPRFWDDGRGVDSGRAFGSAQSDGIAPHVHSYSLTGMLGSASYRPDIFASEIGGFTGGSLFADMAGWGRTSNTPSTEINAGSTIDTRPKNIAYLACIKY